MVVAFTAGCAELRRTALDDCLMLSQIMINVGCMPSHSGLFGSSDVPQGMKHDRNMLVLCAGKYVSRSDTNGKRSGMESK